MDAEEDEGGEAAHGQSTLTGFLFGNIDKAGRLENDVLDEVLK